MFLDGLGARSIRSSHGKIRRIKRKWRVKMIMGVIRLIWFNLWLINRINRWENKLSMRKRKWKK